MLKFAKQHGLAKTLRDNLQAAITYSHKHFHQMDYALFRQQLYTIGSGVTEVDRKTLIKQRLCCTGMRWK
ncbi:MAG: hypothetical protein ACK53E_12485 [Pseudanabaena sp.]